jgi:hypothetical protein
MTYNAGYEVATVSINHKLLDVYYTVDRGDVTIVSVEDTTGTTNLLEFLNKETIAIIQHELDISYLEFNPRSDEA